MASKQVTSMLFPEQAGDSGFGVRPSSISMLYPKVSLRSSL